MSTQSATLRLSMEINYNYCYALKGPKFALFFFSFLHYMAFILQNFMYSI